MIANENHVRLAIGRNYNDCSPVKGIFKGHVEANMHITVSVKTNKDDSNLEPQKTEGSVKKVNNSFKRNMEIMQQQQ